MKRVLRVVLLFVLPLFLSCEEQGLIVKCPDCLDYDPQFASLEIKLDINYQTAATLVKIYSGNLEDDILYKSRFIEGKSAFIRVQLNREYTVTATYYVTDPQGNYYIAVDTATPRVKFVEDQCDYPCYFVYDKSVDLRLKK